MGTVTSARNDRDGPTDAPFVSVIIPVYNDPDGLAETLESLSVQTYPSDRHEVIIVDNGSSDDTPAVAHGYCSRYDRFTLVVEASVQGSYAARNRGVRNASGSIVAFVDADVTVPADWLSRVVDAMDGVDYLACGVRLYSSDAETLAAKYDRLSGFDIDRYVEDLHFAPTCCLVVDAGLFDDVGLFDSRLISSGDLEFGNRVYDSGRVLRYRPDIQMYHPTRESVRSLLKKAVRIGRGRQQLRRFYPERYGSPLFGLLNPGTVLPPLPWNLHERFREWEALTTVEKAAFYALVTATGFARTYGGFREAIEAESSRLVGSDATRLEEGETTD